MKYYLAPMEGITGYIEIHMQNSFLVLINILRLSLFQTKAKV